MTKKALGKCRCHLKPLCFGLLILAVTTYIIVSIQIIWLSKSKTCTEVFYRPFERHRMRIKPLTKNTFPFTELQSNDYRKLIDISNFDFQISNKEICSTPEVFLVVLVASAAGHQNHRQTIRDTWGHTSRNIVVVFFVGYIEDQEFQRQIIEESNLYNDIVQGNVLDTYRNLTYKTIMSFKWFIYHCAQAKYVLKIDDDAFVNMPLLRNFLRHDISPFGAESLFLCNTATGAYVIRDNRSKWFVTKEEYESDVYPTYCNGWYAVISPDVCFKLYREAQKLKYFYIEDVFTYGLAAKKVPGLQHLNFHYYTLAYRNHQLLLNGTFDDLNIVFGSMDMSPDLIRQFWQYFKKKPVPLSLYRHPSLM